MVVAAHPDDEVLGCGGTVARLATEGHSVAIAILGEGITSRYERREGADAELLALHRERCQKAADLVGADRLFTYDLPDNRFDEVPLLEVAKIVEELIDKWQPSAIYTHHGGDLNIDHVIVHRAVLTAARPVAGQVVEEIYAFEIPSSTEWSFGQFAAAFNPSVFIEIDAYVKRKVEAMECYESEARAFPHPRSPDALQAIARRWGSVAGLQNAEAFELIRSVRS